ncbi:hypothetical protein ACG00Y_00160 [Roseateles sp. LYH14W]|uniref:Uncharacterized protein n=2 Tax=Pelomonas parva TaxID=3299032 RepID=A0ABW7EVC3_9BURK
MDRLDGNAISVGEFCSAYEHMWNFQVDKESLPKVSLTLLETLFDEVVWFCPLPRALWEYPKYRDEGEIRLAVASALHALTGKLPTNDLVQ